MMKAVLIFCEGHSDAVFVQRSLEAVSGCTRHRGSVEKLPTPFGTIKGISERGIVARHFDRHVDQLKLREAATPPPLHFDGAVCDKEKRVLYIQIVMGGIDNSRDTIKIINDICATLGITNNLHVKSIASAIVCDANDVGLKKRVSDLRMSYKDCFGDLSELTHAQWARTEKHPFGVFVFHDKKSEVGTLENYVDCMVKSAWPDRYKAAQNFIDCNRANADKVSKGNANRLKGIFTSVGQFQFPGASLSPVIDEKGIPLDEFRKMEVCQSLVDFLQTVPWEQAL